jgi:Tfp pilus assembly protein PilF
MKNILLISVLLVCCIGCQTPPKAKSSQAETISALTTMTQGLTNQPMTEAQLKNLASQVAHDPQAQSALHSINTALSPQHTVKYCPENGERFSADMIYCPDHKVKLEWVE